MASKKAEKAPTFESANVQHIPLHLVDIRYDWNSRSGDFRVDPEYPELVESIQAKGQDTAVLVRPHPDKVKARKTPFDMVVGFRRGSAILDIARKLDDSFKDKDAAYIAKHLGKQAPTIKAEVREMTEAEARDANVRENMKRVDVKAADCAFAVHELLKLGKTTAEIGPSVNKGQTYVDKCKRIMTLPVDVTKHWRAAAIPLTVDEMDQLSRVEGADAQRKAYEAATKNKKPRSSKGKKSKLAALIGQATVFSAKLGALARADLIELTTDDWESLVEHMVNIPDEGFSQKDIRTIGEEAKKQFEASKAERETEETDSAPKGKGKGNRQAQAQA